MGGRATPSSLFFALFFAQVPSCSVLPRSSLASAMCLSLIRS